MPTWPALPRVKAWITTRWLAGASGQPYAACNLGAHCGDEAAAVGANRAALERQLDLPGHPYWLRQVHGSIVVTVDRASDRAVSPPDADAAVTRTPGIVLAVLTADCLPLLICADDGSEVAAIHAGWRGLAGGVIESALGAMHTPPARLLVWLGPAIGPRSYEVGDDVRDAFLALDPSNAPAFAPARPAHWLCDLYALARRRLAALGATRVYGGDFDTFVDPRFYSYRREPVTGRFASLVWIAD